MRRVDAVSFI